MVRQDTTPSNEEPLVDDKKLRKRERRLEERLQQAQEQLAEAEERLRRAEVRLQRRQSRVERFQKRLTAMRQHFKRPQPSAQPVTPPPPTIETQKLIVVVTAPVAESSIPVEEMPMTSQIEALNRVHTARAAAIAAEEAARLVAERVQETANRIEHLGGGRHLLQELEELQVEADKASLSAQERKLQAQQAEQQALALGVSPAETAQVSVAPDDEENTEHDIVVSTDDSEVLIIELEDAEEEVAALPKPLSVSEPADTVTTTTEEVARPSSEDVAASEIH